MVSKSKHLDVPPWLVDHFIGGHPALDFVNTQSHRLDPAISVERLNKLKKITTWLVYQQLLSAPQAELLAGHVNRHNSEADFVNSLQGLRSQAGKLFDALADDQSVPAQALSQVLSISGKENIHIEQINHDGYQASVFSMEEVNTRSVSALIALQILDVIFRLPSQRIRNCPACGWVFYDHSKGSRRKWCDMKACGNRAKVAKHYRTHRQIVLHLTGGVRGG